MSETGISLGLAFTAGLVSFLSPCVLPLVPSYVSFVAGMTLDELATSGTARARREAAYNAALFVLGFALVFVALGATATALGMALRRWLPLVQTIGGIVIILFGLYMLGVVRPLALMRERRVHLAARPAGRIGAVAVGAAFGAGWTPCIGPVLASILLYAGATTTVTHGMLLLAVYSLGLGVPFIVAALAVNWYLAGARRIGRWLAVLERAAGALLVVAGTLLVTGQFTRLTGFFARFGQLVDLQ